MCNNISLSPHFKLQEFTASATARRHGLDNTPPPEAVENLKALCVHTLEPLREALGLPIVITSGYRTKALNKLLVCHSKKSQHMSGEAADFHISVQGEGVTNNGSPTRRELLIKAFRQMILDEGIVFDQLILYPSFIHVSYVRSGSNRSKLTKANGQGSFCALTRDEALAIV